MGVGRQRSCSKHSDFSSGVCKQNVRLSEFADLAEITALECFKFGCLLHMSKYVSLYKVVKCQVVE